MTHKAPFTTGDICAVKLERIGKYIPFQILADCTDGQLVVVLKHFSPEPPSVHEVLNAEPLVIDHHAWNSVPMYICVSDWDFPHDYIGQGPIVAPIEDPNSNGWTLTDTLPIELQYRWDLLPQRVRDAYTIDGVRRINVPNTIHPNYYAHLDTSTAGVTSLVAPSLTPELMEFLSKRPLISQLELTAPTNPRVVDLSTTFVTDLTIDLTGVKRLILNDVMDSVKVCGDDSELERIDCPFDGRFLHLALDITFPSAKVHGLSQVRFAHIASSAGRRLSIPTLANALPHLEKLVVNGNGVIVEGIEALATWPHLTSLWMSECFGFTELVPREQLPRLRELVLWSVPVSVGEYAREHFADCPQVILKQLRKDDWLNAHVNNPFASWLGREDMPAPLTKKAVSAYSKCYLSLSKRTPGKDGSQCLENFMEACRVIDRKSPLDTVDRELVYQALCNLAALTNLPSSFADDLYAAAF